MRQVEPQVFLVAETRLEWYGLQKYLRHIGAESWKSTGASSEGELLVEVMGRACYRSFKPGLNPNVTRVRQSNRDHLQHMAEVGHGSVFEHATVSFMFCDVSRVFTHELVRHRAGTAISQESLRFVRLDDLSGWIPKALEGQKEKFISVFEDLSKLQISLAEDFGLDELPFSEKKKITSAMRRLAPIGLATNIGWTANFRTLRHVLEQRTHPSAEEEIRLVFGKVGGVLMSRYPNAFGDYEVNMVEGYPHYHTKSRKI